MTENKSPSTPASPTPVAPPEDPFTLADFAALKAACSELFPVHLALGGELVPGPKGGLERRNERRLKVMLRRLTSEESAFGAELLRDAVPPKVRDPHTQEERYNFEDPQFVGMKRELESMIRAFVIIRCVPEFEKGWLAYRLESGQSTDRLGKAPKAQRTLVKAQAQWLNENFPDDVLETLRRAAESDVVDEQRLEDFFTKGS